MFEWFRTSELAGPFTGLCINNLRISKEYCAKLQQTETTCVHAHTRSYSSQNQLIISVVIKVI
jgi:hypothetical protein